MIAPIEFHDHDEDRQRALALGGLAAVVWGIAMSLYAFSLGHEEIGWLGYAGLLAGGMAALVGLPPLFVVLRSWLRQRTRRESLRA